MNRGKNIDPSKLYGALDLLDSHPVVRCVANGWGKVMLKIEENGSRGSLVLVGTPIFNIGTSDVSDVSDGAMKR